MVIVVKAKPSKTVANTRLTTLGYGMVIFLCLPLTNLCQAAEDFSQLIFEAAAVPQIPLITAPIGAEIYQGVPTSLPPAAAIPATEAYVGPPLNDMIMPGDITRYEEALDVALHNQDQYSPQLREQYESLGRLLQLTGEHDRAIAMFEKAMQIDRINNGLFTTFQLPLVQQIAISQNALGNRAKEADLQAYIYYIHQKSFAADSEQFLAAKEAWADWNVKSYLQDGGASRLASSAFVSAINAQPRVNEYVLVQNVATGEVAYIPRNQLPFGPGANRALYDQPPPFAVDPERFVDERLRTAEGLYGEILATRASSTVDSADPTVQLKLANIAFAIKKQMDVFESQMKTSTMSYTSFADQPQTNMLVRRSFATNLEALERIAEDLQNSPTASAQEKAAAYINLGDWNAGFDRTRGSAEAYTKALQMLRAANLTDAEINHIFKPQPLVPVPAYAIHDFSRAFYGYRYDVPLDYKGYIDTTVDLDRFGRVSNIRIDAASPDTPRSVRDTLATYLRDNTMRPAVENGELVKLSNIKTRYYYSY